MKEKTAIIIDFADENVTELTKRLQKNIGIYQKCTTLSREDLKGRYKRAYTELKNNIKIDSEVYLKYIALCNLKFNEENYKDAAKEINAFWNSSPEGRSLSERVTKALCKEYSFDEFRSLCVQVREQVKHILWKFADDSWTAIETSKPEWERT